MTSGEGDLQMLKEYGERVAKYIPVEVITLYTSASQFILAKDGDDHRQIRIRLFAIIGLLAWFGTPVLLGTYSNDPRTKRPNQVIGFVAFAVWAYAYPVGWFAELKLNDPIYGGLTLLLFTFGIGFYLPRKD